MRLSAAHVSAQLVELLVRLDDGTRSIAELNRQVGTAAERAGGLRPSYSRVRQLVHELREIRALAGPTTAEVVLDVLWRARHPEELLDHVAGIQVRRI